MKWNSSELIKATVHSVFLFINIMVLILLLLPMLTTNMGAWWLDNLLNLQIQWSLLALLLIIINIFYIKQLRVISILMFSTLISINLLPLYVSDSSATTPLLMTQTDNNQLNIAQINLRYDNPNLAQLLPVLGNKSYDLLIIQEASDEKHQLIKQLTDYYPYHFGISKRHATPDGMAIFSRSPIIENKLHHLGGQHGHLLEVILQKQGLTAPIQLFALHPVSPRNAQLWQTRNETLAILSDIVVASPFTHKLVVGDFNSSPWSVQFKNFQRTSQLKSSASGFGYIASWSYSDKPILSLLSSVYIDHHLVSAPFNVVNKRPLPIQGSDHQLILTELQVSN
ncbi:hypothetical protein GCM10007916_23600 [Psychromonas marina]|uniref:Endonuclease/exonuclease/phosphatase domain-containing protein n=1 Tax=Psychromonas marina TaxID=88364 RepID=A0ABQ6E2T9_9GAMM|nr:endonuclease/exonuclease/phosphatase family protein [Psychromonas marina]GLS91291.1 hypothetical protein GCM10007916_23600 [Psychromonas marina]